MTLTYQSLHNHTVKSDGVLTYKQLLDACAKHGIGVAAFTDHDTLPGKKDLAKLTSLRDHDVAYVVGIELSCESDVHVVGLFVDPTNKKLLEETERRSEDRIKGAREIVSNLGKLGFVITFDEVVKVGRNTASIGRPHIVQVLLKKPENFALLAQIEKKFRAEAAANPAYKDMLDRVNKSDAWQKFFTLVLSENSYVRGVYAPRKEILDFDSAVALIRGACGLAIFAHWTFSRREFRLERLVKTCREKKIDGLETIYGFGETHGMKKWVLKDIPVLQSLVNNYNLIYSGGGDFHIPEEFALMEKEPEMAEETVGLVEQILSKRKVDLTWSSLKR